MLINLTSESSLIISFLSIKGKFNFEEDLGIFVNFIAKYGMSDKVVKEDLGSLKKIADSSSFLFKRADKIVGAYKSLDRTKKSSVDRVISAIRAGSNTKGVVKKKLNAILRNITLNREKANIEETLMVALRPIIERTLRGK